MTGRCADCGKTHTLAFQIRPFTFICTDCNIDHGGYHPQLAACVWIESSRPVPE